MKRIFLFLIVTALISNTLFSQTEKGNILISGASNLITSFSTEYVKNDDHSQKTATINTFNLSPSIGLFVSNNLLIGASTPIVYQSSNDEEWDSEYKVLQILFSPFIRYYFGSSKVKPYVNGTFAYGNTYIKYSSDNKNSFNMASIGLSGGVAIFLNKNVAFDFGLGYSVNSTKMQEDNPNNVKTVTKGFVLSAGIAVVL